MDGRLKIQSVTGTDLEFEIAGPGGRSYAFIIDWHIRLLVALAWILLASYLYSGTAEWFALDDDSPTDYFYLAILPGMAIYFLYHPVLEVLMDGRTPGKRIARIRIVGNDGQPPGIGAHLVRNIFRLVDSLPFAYVIGFTVTLMTERNLRFGDLAAGTLLIYDTANEESALKEIEAMHGQGVGLKEAELIQELITRWDALDAATRVGLGRKLLARLNVELPATSTDAQLLAQLAKALK